MINRLLTALSFAVGVLLAACTGIVRPDVASMDVTVSHVGTKVAMDGLNAVWNTGDEVAVFWDEDTPELWRYEGQDRAVSGRIVRQDGGVRLDGSICRALVPYDAGAAMSSAGILSTPLPSVQTWNKDRLPAELLVASSDAGRLSFTHACGYVRVSLGSTRTLTDAVLSGRASETVAGAVSIDMSAECPSAVLSSDASDRTVTVRSAGQSFSDSTLWFALPPMTLPSGLWLTLDTPDSDTEYYMFDGPVEIKRGVALLLEASVQGLDIMLDFRGGNNPFSETFPCSISQGQFTEEEGRAFYTADGGHEFRFRTPSGESSYGMYYRASNDDVVIGRGGSWIQIPAVDGYDLVNVDFLASNSAPSSPCLSSVRDSSDFASNVITGNLAVGQVYTLWVTGSSGGPHWLKISGSSNFCFRYLLCHYEKKQS